MLPMKTTLPGLSEDIVLISYYVTSTFGNDERDFKFHKMR